MRLMVPLRPDPRAPLARVNPTARLAMALIFMAVAFASIDPLTPTLLLVVLLAAVPASGIRPLDLLVRAWPLLLAAAALAVLNALFAPAGSGAVLLRIGPVELREEALVAGIAVGLRVLAVALAGLIAVVATDPTDLADSLQQQLGLSPRFAVGALAAVRLMPAIAHEWQTLRLARRARGVSAGRSPLAAVRIAAGQLLAILVGAIRRATRLATAMEARGFASRPCRTTARPQAMERRDWLLLAGAAGIGALAVTIGVVLGTWRFLIG
jgi:energy-coupling factor transport system permease protein